MLVDFIFHCSKQITLSSALERVLKLFERDLLQNAKTIVTRG